MRFWCCHDKGTVKYARASGYVLGHETDKYEANGRDLQGIYFRFKATDEAVEIANVEESHPKGYSDPKDYLSKFGDWESMILKAFVENEDSECRKCPKCDETGLLILEDDEEPPERYQRDETNDDDDGDKESERKRKQEIATRLQEEEDIPVDHPVIKQLTGNRYADDDPRYIQ